MSHQLKCFLGALLISLGGLIGCGPDGGSGTTAASTAASTGGSGGSPGTGGTGMGGSDPSGWTAQNSGTVEELDSLHFVDSMIGWAVGSGGTIVKTTDGGANWMVQMSGIGTDVYLLDVHFFDALVGWAVGEGAPPSRRRTAA